MKKFIIPVIVMLIILSSQTTVESQNSFTSNKIEMEKSAIETLLFAYRDALNASDVNQILPLYTKEGVFMPSAAPTSIGTEQVKGAYEFVFSKIKLNIEFFIDEIVIEGNQAYARTSSKGTTLIHATGETVPEENRELFVLEKENDQWKIARYMFNKMK